MSYILGESTELFKMWALPSNNSKTWNKKGKLQLHEWIQGNEIMALTRQHSWEPHACYTLERWDHRRACASLCHQLAKKIAKYGSDPEWELQLGLMGNQCLSSSSDLAGWHYLQGDLTAWRGGCWEEVCTQMLGADVRSHGEREHDPSPSMSAYCDVKATVRNWGGYFYRGSSSVVWDPRWQFVLQSRTSKYSPLPGSGNSGAAW